LGPSEADAIAAAPRERRHRRRRPRTSAARAPQEGLPLELREHAAPELDIHLDRIDLRERIVDPPRVMPARCASAASAVGLVWARSPGVGVASCACEPRPIAAAALALALQGVALPLQPSGLVLRRLPRVDALLPSSSPRTRACSTAPATTSRPRSTPQSAR
jgi:hypothetical protein